VYVAARFLFNSPNAIPNPNPNPIIGIWRIEIRRIERTPAAHLTSYDSYPGVKTS